MSNVIKGWKPASRFSGGIPVRTLRKAVLDERTLTATKQDGTWTFEAADLLAFAAAHGKTASPGIVRASADASSTASTTPPASSEPPTGPIPSWLAAAAARCEREDVAVAHDGDDGDESPSSLREPPFWAAAHPPAYPEGEPYVDVASGRICYRPVPAPPGPHAPGTPGAVVEELQQQLADARAQLAEVQRELEAARTENTRWGAAWRAERVRGLATQEALQAVMSGMVPEVAHPIATAAAQVLGGLSDEQLADDRVVASAARSAGIHAVAAAQAWAGGPYDGGPSDDVAQARARRRQRRW